jgi:hypothetical protein
MGSTAAAVLRLRLIRVKVDGLFVGPSSIASCGNTGTGRLTGGWSPKFRSVDDLLRYFLECFTDSDRSLRRRFDKEGIHTVGKGLAFRSLYLSGELLCESVFTR